MAMLHFAILLFGRISFPGRQHFYRAPGPRACCLGPKFKLLLEHAIASPLASCLPLPLFERYLLVRMIGSRGASSASWALVQTRQGANLVLADIIFAVVQSSHRRNDFSSLRRLVPNASRAVVGDLFLPGFLQLFHLVVKEEIDQNGIDLGFRVPSHHLLSNLLHAPDAATYTSLLVHRTHAPVRRL